MSLQTSIGDITSRLRQGRFPNEQAVSQGIVLRILQELGWDTWDTSSVWPEFQTGEGRADFALCHPPSKPAIFIEVKQPGKAEDAVRQALEYAFHTGVPFIVLTDGKTWGFYLPAEQGSYDDRRVYKLDLFERPPDESASILGRYLARAKVESGEALESARQEYRSRNRRTQARSLIPEAWRELVDKGEELLIELISDAVESKAGTRPEQEDVTAFLTSLHTSGTPRVPAAPVGLPIKPPQVPPMPSPTVESAAGRAGTLTISGKAYRYGNAKEAMVTVLRVLAEADSSFLQRCSQHPDAQGRTRRYVARDPAELYPDRPDLAELNEPLPGGWFVATNLNNQLKKSIIRMAADVAGVEFGKDLTIAF